MTTRTPKRIRHSNPFFFFYLVLGLHYCNRPDLHSVSQKNTFLMLLWSILPDQRWQLRVKSVGGRRSDSAETGPCSLPNTALLYGLLEYTLES